MTERQHRLRTAGVFLMRAATLAGGGVGVILLLTVMTGDQRIACAFAVGALALPIGLAAVSYQAGLLDKICLIGLALMSAVGLVNLNAYLALLMVGLMGAGLVGAVAAAAAVRRVYPLG